VTFVGVLLLLGWGVGFAGGVIWGWVAKAWWEERREQRWWAELVPPVEPVSLDTLLGVPGPLMTPPRPSVGPYDWSRDEVRCACGHRVDAHWQERTLCLVPGCSCAEPVPAYLDGGDRG
jgi:hypothetical protein